MLSANKVPHQHVVRKLQLRIGAAVPDAVPVCFLVHLVAYYLYAILCPLNFATSGSVDINVAVWVFVTVEGAAETLWQVLDACALPDNESQDIPATIPSNGKVTD